MSTPTQPSAAQLFPPCPRCGAAEPGVCQKADDQACALLLQHDKHYVCRCCAAWVGDTHDRFCKLAQGVVTIEFATNMPIYDTSPITPSGVEEIGPSALSTLNLVERRILRQKNVDAFLASSDDQKKRIFEACTEDTLEVACMHSLRLQATYPRVIPDLALLVRRLAYALHYAAPGHPLAEEAMAHLTNERMLGKLPTLLHPEATAAAATGELQS